MIWTGSVRIRLFKSSGSNEIFVSPEKKKKILGTIILDMHNQYILFDNFRKPFFESDNSGSDLEREAVLQTRIRHKGSESDQIRISTTDFIIERWSRYCPMSSQWVGRVDELLTYCPASVWGGWMSWGTCSSWAPVLSPWHWSGDSCSPAYLQEHHTYNLCTKTELINHSKLSTLCCTIWWINSVYNMLSEKKE